MVRDGAFLLARGSRSRPFADAVLVQALGLSGLELASHFTCGRVRVPHALDVATARLNVAVVAVRALCAASRVESVPLAVVISSAKSGSWVRRAGGLAFLSGRGPLAHGLGFAASLVGVRGAGLDANGTGVVPFAEGVAVAETGAGVLDGALGGALLVLLVPFAHVLAEVAVAFGGGGAAAEVALKGDGVPFAAWLSGASSGSREGASLAVGLASSSVGHGGGVAERIGVAIVEVVVERASVLADTAGGPLALTVNIGVTRRGISVASGAALEALHVGWVGHAQRSGAAEAHVGDGGASFGTGLRDAVPDASGVGLADARSLAAETAAS